VRAVRDPVTGKYVRLYRTVRPLRALQAMVDEGLVLREGSARGGEHC
jgi:hypothetical protein